MGLNIAAKEGAHNHMAVYLILYYIIPNAVLILLTVKWSLPRHACGVLYNLTRWSQYVFMQGEGVIQGHNLHGDLMSF
jgi:hypothetical protein